MAKLWPLFRRTARAIACGVVGLLLLQALLILAAESAPRLGNDAAIAASSGAVCRADSAARHTPAGPDGPRHCPSCALGCEGPQAQPVALPGSVVLLATPRSAVALAQPRGERAPAAAGWRSSWSSRAPPIG